MTSFSEASRFCCGRTRQHSCMNKYSRLRALAKQRQRERWPDYKSLSDYPDGIYECDFVSPFTKTAGNVDADVMVLLQDWSSDDELSQGLDENTLRLGYDPTQPTGRNLEQFLNTTFGLSLSDIYGTNVFPFIKRGGQRLRLTYIHLTEYSV